MQKTKYTDLYLDNFPTGNYRLVWYNNIHHFKNSTQDYHITLVFKNLDTDEIKIIYKNIKEVPALSLGAIIRDQKLTKETTGDQYQLLFDFPKHSQTTKTRFELSSFYANEPYFSFDNNDVASANGNKYNLSFHSSSQRFFEYKDIYGQIVLFPTYVIAQYFYFRSASMIAQVMAHTLQDNNHIKGLYKRCTCDSDGNATIVLNPGAANNDGPEIYRFATDDYAFMMFNRIYLDLTNSNKAIQNRLQEKGIESQHNTGVLNAFLPFYGTAMMTIRAEKLSDNRLLVLEILEEESNYPFKTLSILREHKQFNSRLIQMGKIQNRLKAKVTEHLNNKRPDQKFDDVTVHAVKKKDGRIDLSDKEIIYGTLESDEEAESYKVIELTNEKVDLASEQATYNGDTNTAQGNTKISTEDFSTNKEPPPLLDDFLYMLQLASKQNPTFSYITSEYTNLPQKPENDKSKKKWLRAFLADNATSRQYIVATVEYLSLDVCVIDIARDSRMEGLSVLIFRMKDRSIISENTIKTILTDIVKENGSWFSKIAKESYVFSTMKHPSSNSDKELKDWSDLLIKKIEGLISND